METLSKVGRVAFDAAALGLVAAVAVLTAGAVALATGFVILGPGYPTGWTAMTGAAFWAVMLWVWTGE